MSFKVVLIHHFDTSLSHCGAAFLRERGLEVEEGTGLYDIPRHHPALVAMAEELRDMGFESPDIRAHHIEVREVDRLTRYEIEGNWEDDHETLVLEDQCRWVDPTQY